MLNHAASILPAGPQRNEQWFKDSNSCYTHTQVPQTQSQMLIMGCGYTPPSPPPPTHRGSTVRTGSYQTWPFSPQYAELEIQFAQLEGLRQMLCGLLKGIRWQIWLRRDIPTTGTWSQTHPIGHCWILKCNWKKTLQHQFRMKVN